MARTLSYSTNLSTKLSHKRGPEGLGGWLILMVTLLFSVSMVQLYMIMNYYPTLVAWLWITNASAFQAGFMIRLISDLTLLALAALTVYFFIIRSSRLPDLFILWATTLFLTCATMDTCFMYDHTIMPQFFYPNFFFTQLSGILASIIVPYFIASQRVQNTFFAETKLAR